MDGVLTLDIKKYNKCALFLILVLLVVILTGCVDKLRDAIANQEPPAINMNIDIELIPDVRMGKGAFNRLILEKGVLTDNLTIVDRDHSYKISVAKVGYTYKLGVEGSSSTAEANIKLNGETLDLFFSEDVADIFQRTDEIKALNNQVDKNINAEEDVNITGENSTAEEKSNADNADDVQQFDGNKSSSDDEEKAQSRGWVFSRNTTLSSDLPVQNYKIIISGKLEEDIEVMVNNVLVEADKDGNFTEEITNAVGTSYIAVDVKDKNNNRSTFKLKVEFNDELPSLMFDKPVIISENVLNKIKNQMETVMIFDKLQISGMTDEDVDLFFGDKELAVEAGMFSTEVELQTGENTLKFISKDKKTENALEADLNIEYISAKKPNLSINIPENEMAAEDMTTKFDNIEVAGKTDVGCDVFVNGEKVRVKRDGSFSQRINLKAGRNIITVLSVDEEGNSAEVKRRVTFTSDEFPLKIFAPEESTMVTVDISGLTAPNAVVYLENTKVTTGDDGSFSGTLQLTKPGNNMFTITAIDKYGNSQSRNVVVKGIPPRVEVVAPEITTNPEVTIVGVTDTNSTVVMLVGGRKVPVNNNDGTFDITVELDPGLNDFALLATNFFGTTEMPIPIIYDDYANR